MVVVISERCFLSNFTLPAAVLLWVFIFNLNFLEWIWMMFSLTWVIGTSINIYFYISSVFQYAFRVVSQRSTRFFFFNIYTCLSLHLFTYKYAILHTQVFMDRIPNHFCLVPELVSAGWSVQERKEASIPKFVSVKKE